MNPKSFCHNTVDPVTADEDIDPDVLIAAKEDERMRRLARARRIIEQMRDEEAADDSN